MLYRVIVSMRSMRSHGVYELKRRYQSTCHLRQNQRYCDRYFSEAVRGKDARVLYGERMGAESEVYMHCVIPDMDHKKLFQSDVEVKPFIFTRTEDRVRIQRQLLTPFPMARGQLCMLDDLSTQVGILTWNSASPSDFNWSQENIKVSQFALVTVLYIVLVVPLLFKVNRIVLVTCSNTVFSEYQVLCCYFREFFIIVSSILRYM